MKNIKLDKLIDDAIAAKKNGKDNNLLPVAGEIRRMVDGKLSVLSMVRILNQARIKTNHKKLSAFLKSKSFFVVR